MMKCTDITRFDPWFLARIREIIEAGNIVKAKGLPEDELGIRRLKMMGFHRRALWPF